MTLIYNRYYTISSTHYHSLTDTWVVIGTDSLLPANYNPPPTTPAPARTPGLTSLTSPHPGQMGAQVPEDAALHLQYQPGP